MSEREDQTILSKEYTTAAQLRKIQELWGYAPIVHGYDTVADPWGLENGEVHGTGNEWVITQPDGEGCKPHE